MAGTPDEGQPATDRRRTVIDGVIGGVPVAPGSLTRGAPRRTVSRATFPGRRFPGDAGRLGMAGDSGGLPDPAVLADGVTIWAAPGLVTDATRPDLGAIAALTCVPSMTLHASDDHPGADPVDLVASNLLGQGFALLTAFDPATLVALPILEHWVCALTPDGRRLTVLEPAGVLYDGDLASAVPAGWHDAVDRRGLLVLLVSTDTGLRGPGQVTSMDSARRAGNVVAAQVRVQRHP
jgi:hypothetical protein